MVTRHERKSSALWDTYQGLTISEGTRAIGPEKNKMNTKPTSFYDLKTIERIFGNYGLGIGVRVRG